MLQKKRPERGGFGLQLDITLTSELKWNMTNIPTKQVDDYGANLPKILLKTGSLLLKFSFL